ncbi:hypothetical protein ACT009_14795 [Sphingomonas sp. Tas61C01]|uniref:hypothetical protein n=1 Tax=Sphingomonas sp. Tas61C01 TaxID=3458297 RepID=UPI00403E6EDA
MGGEIIYIIPAVLEYAAVMMIVSTFSLWLFRIGARRWVLLARLSEMSHLPVGATASVLSIISLIVGVIIAAQPVPQPRSARTVAAFEVPLNTALDRADLLSILRSEAARDDLTVEVETAQEMRTWAEMSPELRRSIDAVAYRGGHSKKMEVTISDKLQLGHVWVIFFRGEDLALARRFRAQLMARIFQRWPNTLRVPVAQTRALPLIADLIRNDAGYQIDPARLATYICGPAPENAPASACH